MYPGRKPQRLTAPAPPFSRGRFVPPQAGFLSCSRRCHCAQGAHCATLYEPTGVILDSWKLGLTMRQRRFAHSGSAIPCSMRGWRFEPAGKPPLQNQRDSPSQRAASAFDSVGVRAPSDLPPTVSLSGCSRARPVAAFAIGEVFVAGSAGRPAKSSSLQEFNEVSAQRVRRSCVRWSPLAEGRG